MNSPKIGGSSLPRNLFGLYTSSARKTIAATKRQGADLLASTLNTVGMKPRGTFSKESKIIAALARRAPQALAYGTIGAGVAAAVFTHSQWLPTVVQFLHTPGGMAVLGTLAAVGVGLAAVYLGRKSKASVSQWMNRHMGQGPAAGAPQTPATPGTPASKAATPDQATSPEGSPRGAPARRPATAKAATGICASSPFAAPGLARASAASDASRDRLDPSAFRLQRSVSSDSGASLDRVAQLLGSTSTPSLSNYPLVRSNPR